MTEVNEVETPTATLRVVTPKEIRRVTMHHDVDTDPDLSYLGSYSNTPGEYAFDRRAAEHGDQATCRNCCNDVMFLSGSGWMHLDWEGDVDAEIDHDAMPDRDYVGHGWDPHTYRYFNPNWENYIDETDEDRGKCICADFERMESYNAGQWHMVGIYAQADIVVAGTCQEVRSGGLWGIESDSDDESVTEIETEQLGDLTLILKELGFSQEAIEEAYEDLSDAE